MTINEKLKTIPAPIKEWFRSEEVTDVIIAIETRFDLPAEDSILSKMLFDLIVKDLPLEEFENDLKLIFELTPAVAREVYEEIKLRILIPIATDLVADGIGTAELAFAAKAASAAPVPVGPQLGGWSPVLPGSPAPAAIPAPVVSPAAPASPVPASGMPPASGSTGAPVPLYRDALSSQAYVTPQSWNVASPVGSGDLAPASRPMSASIPPRAAHIDLGAGIPAQQAKMNSFFVERTTPLPQNVDYGAKAPAPAAPSAAPTPISLQDFPSAAPMPAPEIAAPAPSVTQPAGRADTEVPSGGFVDSLMKRIAPWHSAKFGNARRASEVLENPIPSKSIDYSEAPAAPDLSIPQSMPTPIDDLPAPPRA